LDSKGLRVCFKPVHGEGGAGFRVINEAVNSLDSLYGPINHRISLEQTITILSGQETFPDLMVLEFLDGNEYSIDCLAYEGKLLAAVPRVKLGGRIQLLEDNEEMLNIAHHVAERYRLPYVFNIQLKSRDGVPKLLEINPRMSGGLHMASFTGVNFPYYAIKLLLEGKIEVPRPTLNLTVSYVEDAVLIKNLE
ncbi:MAG: ATP-grasp domain-containing protein, partial [Bacilli bacterium]